jgi:hypothetical protein
MTATQWTTQTARQRAELPREPWTTGHKKARCHNDQRRLAVTPTVLPVEGQDRPCGVRAAPPASVFEEYADTARLAQVLNERAGLEYMLGHMPAAADL